MQNDLLIYNTLSRTKEKFNPLNPPFVGLYVCGPTVYGDAHLGHARPYIIFDVLYRYLRHNGYKVRYVRNITDVGHLENDADEGEDKIAKKARLEQLEPMEVVKYYTDRFHDNMDRLNTLRPSIEPTASGHIIEQIRMIKEILENGFAYEVDGSVYFDVPRYNETENYGKLSGRKVEDLFANTRELEGQQEKRSPLDFALWKRAQPQHIMRWPSPWGDGFPGWHLECSAMSTKYLGDEFDIHGGGMDLLFPHHECEIAQSRGSKGHDAVRYWMHNNMITINGQKMGKSLGNFITLEELFSGTHKLLAQPYSPMTIRFFILQAHYRSTLDFSNEALQAAEKGLQRLMHAHKMAGQLRPSKKSDWNVAEWKERTYEMMNDDLNTPRLIAELFDAASVIHKIKNGQLSLDEAALEDFRAHFYTCTEEILGLQREEESADDKLNGVLELLLSIRNEARARKDFATSDKIRDELQNVGIKIMDAKEGARWEIE
ncbi:MAG: cysteine--tRNA ligase [Bacteroidia bacterium]